MAKRKTESTANDKIVAEAKKRFALCQEREADNRKLFEEDLKFANADPDNGWQWDEAMRKQRIIDKRPHLTINKCKQHNRQITNDARQNKPSIRVLPVDSGADKKTADVFNGIIRHIEANSAADTAYDTAAEFAVDAGLGYWRVTTDYAAEDTFDQEIFIRRVKNPLAVWLDPDIQEADGSDARFGGFYEDIAKEEFEARYPDHEPVSWESDDSGWMSKDTIRICEYYCKSEKADTLVAGPDGETFLLSTVQDPEVVKLIKADESIQKRDVKSPVVKWYLLAGDQVLEKRDWLGKFIPIVRVVGDEIEIDGKTERKGHTRSMKDAQKMYNFWTTSAVEFVALQGKQPYLAPAEAVEGYEKYWDNLNTSNLPYVPYNHVDEQGSPIPQPQRQQPPVMAQAYMQGMQLASDEMKAASGQYDATFGENANQQSGRALNALQRKGDNATFHFVDNVARAIRYTGKILVDLIPKVYDTQRVVRILGEDGNEDRVQIDPQQKKAITEQPDPQTGEIKEIYNPSVGRYDVVVAVGPSYGTKRQEAFNALTEMSSRNPQLIQLAGDLIMKAADFPMAEQIAERLERALPPGLKEDDKDKQPDPQVAEMDKTIKQLDEVIQKMTEELESRDIENRKVAVDEYNAETNRLKVVGPAMNQEQIQLMVMQAITDAIRPYEAPQDREPMQQMQPEQPETPPPEQGMMAPEQPADAGFFTPDGTEQL